MTKKELTPGEQTREKQTSKEVLPESIPKISFSGLGGSGKTYIANLLIEKFESNIKPKIFKIGGLGNGDDERIDSLREIRKYREQIAQSGKETEKQIADRERDRIYHLASLHQARKFSEVMSSGNTSFNIAILDRTPFVGWAYAKAKNPESPFLEDIYKKNLEVAKKIGLETAQVFLFDVPADETYARSLARYFTGEDNAEQKMYEAIKIIEAPKEINKKIVARALEIIEIGTPKKPFENWHFPLYEFTVRHRQTYIDALERAQGDMGFELIIIDASESPEKVISSIMSKINLPK